MVLLIVNLKYSNNLKSKYLNKLAASFDGDFATTCGVTYYFSKIKVIWKLNYD
jgi:hypothetical protein